MQHATNPLATPRKPVRTRKQGDFLLQHPPQECNRSATKPQHFLVW